jgi:hypothetical protein
MATVTTNDPALSDEQLAYYDQHGYLALDSFVSPEWLQALQAASDEFVEQSRTADTSSRQTYSARDRGRRPRLAQEGSTDDLRFPTEVTELIRLRAEGSAQEFAPF